MSEASPHKEITGHHNIVNHVALSDGGVRILAVFLVALMMVMFCAGWVALKAQLEVKSMQEKVGGLQDRIDRADLWGQEVSGQLDRLQIDHRPYPRGR